MENWVVVFESRFVGGPTSREWRRFLRSYRTHSSARRAALELAPGPNGNFGPIEYRNVMVCMVNDRIVDAEGDRV